MTPEEKIIRTIQAKVKTASAICKDAELPQATRTHYVGRTIALMEALEVIRANYQPELCYCDQHNGEEPHSGMVYEPKAKYHAKGNRMEDGDAPWSGRMTARFWTWINDGYVKISLKAGQELTHHKWWRHEEGWSSETHTWTHHGQFVTRDYGSDGRDCDGRLSTYHADSCHILRLHGNTDYDAIVCRDCGNDWRDDGFCGLECPLYPDEHKRFKTERRPNLPQWQEIKSGQRDWAAEAMNY